MNMKNVVCPISYEKIDENLTRLIAVFVVLLALTFVFTGNILPILVIAIDMFARGAGYGQFSLLFHLSRALLKLSGTKPVMIDKGPKLFAARVGFFLGLLIVLSAITGFSVVSITLALVLVTFASLECVFGICVACYLYTLFLFPRLYKN
jgi:hypothetical protein